MGERNVFSVAPPGLWWSLGCGIMWSLGSESHGSRRGLIANAPTGAGEQHYRSAVLNSEAGELEQRIANNVAKLLEEAS